jgi:hypothetical protein
MPENRYSAAIASISISRLSSSMPVITTVSAGQ